MSIDHAAALATDPLARVRTNPLSRARTRESVAITTEAARRAGSYIAGAAHRPVYPSADALANLQAFRHPLSDGPRPAREVLAELDRIGSPATTVSNQGRYFGFVNGGTDPAALGASILATAWDQNSGGHIMSPVAATLDEVARGWVIDALGLPLQAVASFCAGATVANLTGIITARDALLARAGWDVGERGLTGAPALRVVVGEEAHASVLKALRLAGIGTAQIERVRTDANGAVAADAFPADTDALTLVVLQAGNVNTGHSDPFSAIIPEVRKRGGWVHVDGAFGLWAAASPRLRHLVEGVELADSWATDAHKWLNVPYDSGIAIVRDGDSLGRAIVSSGAYLRGTEDSPMHRGIQLSQRARGVEVWAMLSSHGRTGLADLIERTCEHAARLHAALAHAGICPLAPVALNQVLVAFPDSEGNLSDDITAAVIAAVQAEGTLWAGGTVWQGRRAMRLSVSDAATTRDDVDASAEAIIRAWRSAVQ